MHYVGWGMGGGPEWGFLPVVALFALWGLFWKGLALWHASQRKEPWWFLVILVINTVGILEIVYLFVIAKLKFAELFSMFPRSATPSSTVAAPEQHGQ